MRTAKQIAESVHPGIGPIAGEKRDSLERQIHAYARQCCEDLRQRCADDNLRVKLGISIEQWQLLHKSILDTTIELP